MNQLPTGLHFTFIVSFCQNFIVKLCSLSTDVFNTNVTKDDGRIMQVFLRRLLSCLAVLCSLLKPWTWSWTGSP